MTNILYMQVINPGMHELIVQAQIAKWEADFLAKMQDTDGGFYFLVYPRDSAYENALATIALCEAYGLTQDRRLRGRAQAAVNFIVRAQHAGGSWGYSPGTEGDIAVPRPTRRVE